MKQLTEAHRGDKCMTKSINKSSAIRNLDPFMGDGLLRVGGRLTRQYWSWSKESSHAAEEGSCCWSACKTLPREGGTFRKRARSELHLREVMDNQRKNSRAQSVEQLFWFQTETATARFAEDVRFALLKSHARRIFFYLCRCRLFRAFLG